jgi:hypothetical protein
MTFWENWSVRFAKLEHPVFAVIRWSIFMNGCHLYIFHMFSGYACVSRIIWLNFTEEIKKYFKLQEDELQLKI